MRNVSEECLFLLDENLHLLYQEHTEGMLFSSSNVVPPQRYVPVAIGFPNGSIAAIREKRTICRSLTGR